MSSKSQLVFESTVAKSLVHKRAIAEVLITDSLQCDQRALVLGSNGLGSIIFTALAKHRAI